MKNHIGTDHNSINETCKNCGTELHGPYCSHCGQHRGEDRLTFGTIVRDFLGEVFSLDSRLGKTLRLLLREPGHITSQYLEGHRVPYIPPIRLYIIISFIYFLLVMLISPNMVHVTVAGKNKSKETRPAIFGLSVNQKGDSEKTGDVQEGQDWFEKTLKEKARKLTREEDQFQSTIGQNLPRMMFFLVPFFALFIKILYRKTDLFYFEHLIFSLHIHSFAFLWLTITLLLESALMYLNGPLAEIAALLMKCWIPIYLFKALRCVYSGGVWSTILREILLLGSYFVLTILCLALLIILSLFLL